MEESFLFKFLLLCLLVSESISSLVLSQDSLTKVINQTFVVVCKDKTGRAVKWRGPKGKLGLKTRPKVETTSFGTSITFAGALAEDAGVYYCSNGIEEKPLNLRLEVPGDTLSPDSAETQTHSNKFENDNNHRHHNKYNYLHNRFQTTQTNTKDPLSFMDTPSDQSGREGEDITLRCEARGAQVSWTAEDGTPLEDSKYRIMGDGLLIKNASRSDSRTYVCTAIQQSTGTVQDRKIKLTVLHKPSLPTSPSRPVYAKHEIVYGYLGGLVNLTCEVEADPPPSFDWHYLGRNRPSGVTYKVSSHISVLEVRMKKETFGKYKCVAKNTLGSLEKTFSLMEGIQPDPPLYLDLVEAHPDSLDLKINSTEDEGDEIEENRPLPLMRPQWINVQYKAADSEEDWQSQEFNITIDQTYQLLSLQENTTYEVRAATRNIAGLSDFTESFNFTTSSADCVRFVWLVFAVTYPAVLLSSKNAFIW